MSWEIVASTGEWAGALAVVATLFYLARQIRQNSVQIKLYSSQIATNEYSGLIVGVLQDPVKLKTFRAGLDDYLGLELDQQAMFHSIMLGFLMALTNSRQLVAEGVIESSAYKSWTQDFERILACRGAWEWWQTMSDLADPEFYRELSSGVENSDQPALNQAMPFLRPDGENTDDA